jgi:hypothetical protein
MHGSGLGDQKHLVFVSSIPASLRINSRNTLEMSLSTEGCAIPASGTVYGVEDAQNPSTGIMTIDMVSLSKKTCV